MNTNKYKHPEAIEKFREMFLNTGDQIASIDGYQEELEQFIDQLLGERDREVINLRADIAYAIGHAEGCGHPIKYLEKRYLELKQPK